MPESGEHYPRPDVGEKQKLPERFDHLGRRFESPQADLQLSLLQAKLAENRRQPTAVDLIDVINCELDDVDEQKTYVMEDRDLFNTATRKLRNVRKIVIDAAAHQFDEIGTQDRTAVNSYLDRQAQRWEIKANDPNATQPQRLEAQENQRIFAQLRESIFEPKPSDIEEGAAEDFANAHEIVDDKLQEKEGPPPPAYEFLPALSKEKLVMLRDKDELSLQDVQSLYNATVLDMDDQRERFDEEHPGIRTAVKYALWYKKNHKDEPELEKKKIFVTQLPDTQVNVGFELSIKKPPEGARSFVFTLTDTMTDANDLSANAKYIDDFDAAYADAKKAQEVITKLYENDEEFMARTADYDDDALEDVISAVRIIDWHKTYIRTHSDSADDYTDDEKKDYETLDKLSAIITEKTNMGYDDDEEYI